MSVKAIIIIAFIAVLAGAVVFLVIRQSSSPNRKVTGKTTEGFKVWGEGKADIARDIFSRVLREENKNIREGNVTEDAIMAYVGRAGASIDLEDPNQAFEDADTAIKLNPEIGDAYLYRGRVYLLKGETKNALNDFTDALHRAPECKEEVYLFCGMAYNILEYYTQAIADYNKALELNPDYTVVYFNRGNAYYHAKNYNPAIEDFNMALKFEQDKAKVYFSRGNAYDGQEDYDLAIADFDKVIELDKNNAEAYFKSRQ